MKNSVIKVCPRCGKEFRVGLAIENKRTYCSKECYRPNTGIIIGGRYGRITVLEEVEGKVTNYSGKRDVRRMAKCVCDCGVIKIIGFSELKSGLTTSCGCYCRELNRSLAKHGHASEYKKSKEYSTWNNMKTRCLSKNDKGYAYYGAIGITITSRWLGAEGFQNFLEDMGECPDKTMSLDRIDNKGNYEKSNCRWATRAQQSNNRRDTKYVIYEGETIAIGLVMNKFNIIPSHKNSILYRMSVGMSFEDSLKIQIEKHKDKYER